MSEACHQTRNLMCPATDSMLCLPSMCSCNMLQSMYKEQEPAHFLSRAHVQLGRSPKTHPCDLSQISILRRSLHHKLRVAEVCSSDQVNACCIVLMLQGHNTSLLCTAHGNLCLSLLQSDGGRVLWLLGNLLEGDVLQCTRLLSVISVCKIHTRRPKAMQQLQLTR